jgi:hypothetical protein
MNPGIQFFMVWRDGSFATRFRHDTEHSAKAEAARLARETPGTKFYVLCALGFAEQPPPPPEPSIYHVLDDGIPF